MSEKIKNILGTLLQVAPAFVSPGFALGAVEGRNEINKRKLDARTKRYHDLANVYAGLANDNDLDPQIRAEARQRTGRLATFDPFDSKQAKEFEGYHDFSDMFTRAEQARAARRQDAFNQDAQGTGGAGFDTEDLYQNGYIDKNKEYAARQRIMQNERRVMTPPDLRQQIPELGPEIDPQLLPYYSGMARDRAAMQRAELMAKNKATGKPQPVMIRHDDGRQERALAVYTERGWIDTNTQYPVMGTVEPLQTNSQIIQQDWAKYFYAKEIGVDPRNMTPEQEGQAWMKYRGMMAESTNVNPTPVVVMGPQGVPVTQYVPGNQANNGMNSPRTIHMPDGNTSYGGVLNYASTQAPAVAASTTEALEAWGEVIKNVDNTMNHILGSQNSIQYGPAWGRIRNVKTGALGGWGATQEEQELAIMINNLFTDRAFADGGKNLTGTEQKLFRQKLPDPNGSDTVEQMFVKLKAAKAYAESRRQAKVSMINPRSRKVLNLDGDVAAPPEGPQVSVPNKHGKSYKIGDVITYANGEKRQILAFSPDGRNVLKSKKVN